MTVRFSPGPWSIDRKTLFESGYGRKSLAIVDANKEPVLLFDPSQCEYYEAMEVDSPDAYLIAAAPDLLIALKMLKQWVYTEVRHFGANEPDEFIKQAVNAAINKAENIQYQSS